jgi:hypothetical protein
LCDAIAKPEKSILDNEGSGKVLYVSGEESAEQVKMRADRLGIDNDNLMFLGETDIDAVESQIEDLKTRINEWENKYFEGHFYMLLCREINYYTVFQHRKPIRAEFDTLGNAVIYILLESDWTIHSDEIEEDSDHCEIWATNKEDTFAFMLFPYDEGVVTYG